MILAISDDTLQQWPMGIAPVFVMGSYLAKYQRKYPMLMQKASH